MAKMAALSKRVAMAALLSVVASIPCARAADEVTELKRAIFRLITLWVGLAQHGNGFKRFRARAAQSLVHGLRVHCFEAAFDHRDVVRLTLPLAQKSSAWGQGVQQGDRGGAAQRG